ncbi:MAG: dihydrolipoyl dehydrogenase [Nitrososphaerota archaeon]
MNKKFDIIIIGGGPAGYSAAKLAAIKGLKTALIEKEKIGGICVNVGCVPTKAMIFSAELVYRLQKSLEYGIKIDNFSIDFKKIMERNHRISERVSFAIKDVLENLDVKVYNGIGRLKSKNEIEVVYNNGEKETINAKNIILATGSRPADIPLPGSDEEDIIYSENFFKLEELPSSVCIIGAGAIGTEFATALNAFGSEVTLIEIMPNIIPTEDSELTEALKFSLEMRGVNIFTSACVKKIESKSNVKKVYFNYNGEEKTIEVEKVIIATGRKPNIENLGLENIGIKLNNGKIVVDEYLRTSIPNIYAVGDVIGKYYLAHTAMIEGEIAARNILGENIKIDYSVIPRCIFTIPELATVGLSEKQAREAGMNIKTVTTQIVSNTRALGMGETEGMIKIVTLVNAYTGKIIGIHMLGPLVTEVAGEATLVIKYGVSPKDIVETFHAHPTIAEAIRDAALKIITS